MKAVQKLGTQSEEDVLKQVVFAHRILSEKNLNEKLARAVSLLFGVEMSTHSQKKTYLEKC